MNRIVAISFFITAFLSLQACSSQPAEIHYGSDECAHCKMMITDNRFASQIVTATGKAIKFDAIECMANYAGDHKSKLKGATFWVINFEAPGTWIPLRDATIIRNPGIHSPMGASLLAFKSAGEAENHLNEYSGEYIQWDNLVK